MTLDAAYKQSECLTRKWLLLGLVVVVVVAVVVPSIVSAVVPVLVTVVEVVIEAAVRCDMGAEAAGNNDAGEAKGCNNNDDANSDDGGNDEQVCSLVQPVKVPVLPAYDTGAFEESDGDDSNGGVADFDEAKAPGTDTFLSRNTEEQSDDCCSD